MRALGTLVLAVALAATAARRARPGRRRPARRVPPPRRRPAAAAAAPAAVIGSRVIGHSVRGRAIRAWHLGEPGTTKVVLIAGMHGNEAAPRQILRALADGGPIRGIEPVGGADVQPRRRSPRGTRKNAHGVDLNRNFPHRWADLDGGYESGRGPASEPETRADDALPARRAARPGAQLPPAAPRRRQGHQDARPTRAGWPDRLDLPAQGVHLRRRLPRDDDGLVQQEFRGTAITVEYGAHPPRRRMRRRAPAPGAVDLGRHAARTAVGGPVGATSAQRPWKTGFSLATNAATAAWWSARWRR